MRGGPMTPPWSAQLLFAGSIAPSWHRVPFAGPAPMVAVLPPDGCGSAQPAQAAASATRQAGTNNNFMEPVLWKALSLGTTSWRIASDPEQAL
jgi:hypothetical protein